MKVGTFKALRWTKFIVTVGKDDAKKPKQDDKARANDIIVL